MRFWTAVKAAMSGVEDDGSFESPGGPEDCERLRAEAFLVTADQLDLGAEWGCRPYGVIMDTAAERGTATVVAFANGASSLYVSSGGGVVGRASHVHVAAQAKRLVKEAAEYVEGFDAAAAFPYPAPRATRFYLLTRDGAFTAGEETAALAAGQSPLSPLFGTGRELLSEFLTLTL
ncbi:MAG TPA: hypothetical protein VGX37_02170 [Allosphingosinicella sp.]|jgi:hypothetical protein|nr:hypothetical protein [Allosphingosinicella sp.]